MIRNLLQQKGVDISPTSQSDHYGSKRIIFSIGECDDRIKALRLYDENRQKLPNRLETTELVPTSVPSNEEIPSNRIDQNMDNIVRSFLCTFAASINLLTTAGISSTLPMRPIDHQ